MNDNDLIEEDYPEWVWELLDRHEDIGLRSDCPLNAVGLLLSDTADLLKELEETAFREQAITAETRNKLVACEALISDAIKLDLVPQLRIILLPDVSQTTLSHTVWSRDEARECMRALADLKSAKVKVE